MFPHPVQIENGFRPQSQPQNGHFLVDCSDPMLTGTIGYLVVYNRNRGVAESENPTLDRESKPSVSCCMEQGCERASKFKIPTYSSLPKNLYNVGISTIGFYIQVIK